MIRIFFSVILLFFFTRATIAQVRIGTMLLKPGETFELKNSDILVVDTLIMMDSSRIILNKLKNENYIRAQVVQIGRHCLIDGQGTDGQPGRDGKNGSSPLGPCQDGTPGKNGGRGLDGTPGINLFLYLDNIKITGQLIINLSGGNGGGGGNGGNGGSGGSGTNHCHGGNGANGGNAGQGGNGANGGTLTINCKSNPAVEKWVGTKILVIHEGGKPGPQGRIGYQGNAGLGPSKKHGKNGVPGLEAFKGRAGLKGGVNFEKN